MKSRYFMPLLVSTTFGLALWHFLVLQSFPSNHNILCPEAQTVYVKEILSVDNEVSDQKCSSKRNITRNLSQTAVIILFISAILTLLLTSLHKSLRFLKSFNLFVLQKFPEPHHNTLEALRTLKIAHFSLQLRSNLMKINNGFLIKKLTKQRIANCRYKKALQDFKLQQSVWRKKNQKLKRIATRNHFRKLNGDQLKQIIDEIFAKRFECLGNFNVRKIEDCQESSESSSERSDPSASSVNENPEEKYEKPSVLLVRQLEDNSKSFLYRLFSR